MEIAKNNVPSRFKTISNIVDMRPRHPRNDMEVSMHTSKPAQVLYSTRLALCAINLTIMLSSDFDEIGTSI